jgi:hypothetical protein
MANSNFVVHNGLTVGPTTIDAASGNVTIPVGKQITIGNVLLRDNGNGRLAVRDITDNSDVIIDATLDAGSTTAGNIQIGTNHIESTNANGPVSIRPNGAGNIALAANTVMLGKGGAYTLISTGEQTDASLGINYTPSNIIVQTTGALSSGNVRVSMTTAASSTTTGALQVMGGVGVVGNIHCASITAGTYVGLSSQRINQDASNVIVTTSYVNVAVNGSNIASFGAQGIMPTANASGTLGSSGVRWNNVFAVNGGFLSVNANYADLAEKYVADADYAPGTVLMFGGDKEVTQCDTDMSSRVAGVVSTNPAYLMNSGLEGEHTVELALTGRVPTKVRGPILKGDLIVSAGDGHARAEGIPQVGTVIGKALENFDGDTGVIEVVVGKH